jgi:hypothetical protein
MSSHDRQLENQDRLMRNLILEKGLPPRLVKEAGYVAGSQGLTLWHYDQANQLFYFSDGEPYTHEAIQKEISLIQ